MTQSKCKHLFGIRNLEAQSTVKKKVQRKADAFEMKVNANFDVAEGKVDTSVFGGKEVESRLVVLFFWAIFDITFTNHDTLQY